MTDLATQLALVAGVLLTFLVGPGSAIAFLMLRKRRRKALRRAPINVDLLRGPGHTLREELEEITTDLIWDVFVLATMPLVVLATYLAQAHVRGLQEMAHLIPVYVLAVLFVIGLFIRKMLKAGVHLDRLRAGFDAELAAGQELDQLMRQGAVVYHDFPAENFNIDHVVISTQGVFAVETKGYTKPADVTGRAGATVVFDGRALKFPTWTTQEPLAQAERQAQWLGKWLSSAVGERIQATPVLALPGWFVEQTGTGTVRVFNGKLLAGLLQSRGAQPLSMQDVQRVAHQVDQRCRTVVPTYRRSEENP